MIARAGRSTARACCAVLHEAGEIAAGAREVGLRHLIGRPVPKGPAGAGHHGATTRNFTNAAAGVRFLPRPAGARTGGRLLVPAPGGQSRSAAARGCNAAPAARRPRAWPGAGPEQALRDDRSGRRVAAARRAGLVGRQAQARHLGLVARAHARDRRGVAEERGVELLRRLRALGRIEGDRALDGDRNLVRRTPFTSRSRGGGR